MVEPLTPIQQAFAEAHHDLLLDFMKKHSLDSDFYGLLAQRYLKVVVRYTTESELRKYAFSTILWYHLRSELASFYKELARRTEAERNYLLKIPIPDDPPLDDEMWKEIEQNLTRKQYEVIKLRDAGYSNREIAKICGVQRKAIEKRFSRIRKAIRKFME